MAASATVCQFPHSYNLIAPRHGVITLSGHGITASVDRGHLLLKDGIGNERRGARLPRVGHGLRRLVVIGCDGFVSLAALRWLSDQDAAFVMLERDGSVLATTGPVHSSDARLRRAQSLSSTNGLALQISKDLIRQKLNAQEALARKKLTNNSAANLIAANRAALEDAPTVDVLRLFESRAAHAYWSAWRDLPITFPKQALPRVPKHWRSFGARISPLTRSPRLAVNPPNAILNFLYTILESEARLAAAAMGLDPGIGLMHVDTPTRDSLACDLMEPVRPLVDEYLLDWLKGSPFSREWFFEERDGNCRLMGSFAVNLSETATTWGRLVAPIVESVARRLWSKSSKSTHSHGPATRLTQANRRQAKGFPPGLPIRKPPRPACVCEGCGAPLLQDNEFCCECGLVRQKERFVEVARLGRRVAQGPKAQAKRSKTQRRNALAQNAWNCSGLPAWLNDSVYAEKIQPRLRGIKPLTLAAAIGVSRSYAMDIQAGRRRPHPRHWEQLALLTNFTASS